MRFSLLFACAFAAPLALLGCSAPSTEETVETDSTEAADSIGSTSTFYIVTRPDLRRCAYPYCGGYYVKRVNRSLLVCSDGSVARECRVLGTDLSALAYNARESDRAESAIREGHALVRARMGYSDGVPKLLASEVWVGAAQSEPAGDFYRVRDNGRRCIVSPCASTHEARLNSSLHQEIAVVDFTASGASRSQVDEALDALESDSVLVAGTHGMVSGPGGRLPSLKASEFYTRFVHVTEEGDLCGGNTGVRCGEGQFCDAASNACGWFDDPGFCTAVPSVCPRIYRPVCGCDGNTYGNDCARRAAKVQFDHTGTCE